MTKIVIAASALLLIGCAGMPTMDQGRQMAASGHVGCPAPEIQITTSDKYTWTAVCKGKTFYCTSVGEVACKEAIKAPA